MLGAHRLQFCGLPTSGHPLLPTTLGQAAGTAAAEGASQAPPGFGPEAWTHAQESMIFSLAKRRKVCFVGFCFCLFCCFVVIGWFCFLFF